jgi:hypothetical protein
VCVRGHINFLTSPTSLHWEPPIGAPRWLLEQGGTVPNARTIQLTLKRINLLNAAAAVLVYPAALAFARLWLEGQHRGLIGFALIWLLVAGVASRVYAQFLRLWHQVGYPTNSKQSETIVSPRPLSARAGSPSAEFDLVQMWTEAERRQGTVGKDAPSLSYNRSEPAFNPRKNAEHAKATQPRPTVQSNRWPQAGGGNQQPASAKLPPRSWQVAVRDDLQHSQQHRPAASPDFGQRTVRPS